MTTNWLRRIRGALGTGVLSAIGWAIIVGPVTALSTLSASGSPALARLATRRDA
jgi:hypothetical protein